jgi:hypothetical protein
MLGFEEQERQIKEEEMSTNSTWSGRPTARALRK